MTRPVAVAPGGSSGGAAEAAESPLDVRGSLGRVAAIASLSARETLRSRSMVVAVVLNLIYLGLLALTAVSLQGAGLEEAFELAPRDAVSRITLSVGIAGASMLALFLGLFSSVGAIANEIERGTILAVAARPVSRWEIVLGKFLGNGVLAVAYLVVQGLAIGVVLAALTGIFVTDLLVTLALLSLNVLIVVAVALLGSTRMSMVANAVVVIVSFFALTNTGILYVIGEFTDDALLRAIAEWSRLVLPVGAISDHAGMILQGPTGRLAREALEGRVLLPRWDWSWIYGLGYLAAVLGLAGWSLMRRDLR